MYMCVCAWLFNPLKALCGVYYCKVLFILEETNTERPSDQPIVTRLVNAKIRKIFLVLLYLQKSQACDLDRELWLE